jgi:hypothetical protein
MVLEQGGKQYGLVTDLDTVPHQRFWQLLERQVGIGRDEIKVKRDAFHGR